VPRLPFFPAQGSVMAGQVDALVLFMLAASTLITLTIFFFILAVSIKYRRRPGNLVARQVTGTTRIEVAWSVIPLGLALVPFVWGATLYLDEAQPPSDAMEVYVVAKQWMWKAQHPEGQAEIDALHVPVGRPVKLTMTSQDVIHSFYVPAFRVKADVLPGRYTTLWFQATDPGDYELLCAEYCGTDHSRMRGHVIAMRPSDYADWLASGATATNAPAAQGRQVFLQFGCAECHEAGRAPDLHGVFGQPVLLQDGTSVQADANYLRESIVRPSANVVYGYQPIMPAFAGRLGEDEIVQLIEYIRSIGPVPGQQPAQGPGLLPVPAASPSPVAAEGGRP
jgi:cytochrome c oxidase subunit 2